MFYEIVKIEKVDLRYQYFLKAGRLSIVRFINGKPKNTCHSKSQSNRKRKTGVTVSSADPLINRTNNKTTSHRPIFRTNRKQVVRSFGRRDRTTKSQPINLSRKYSQVFLERYVNDLFSRYR